MGEAKKTAWQVTGGAGKEQYAITRCPSELNDLLTVEIEASLDSTKATFDKVVSALRWLGTNGLRTLMQFWFQKNPMFWLPTGWVPYYAEWLLSFPRAPLGSVSIQAWALACGSVILLVSDATIAGVGLFMTGNTASQQKRKEEPLKSSVGSEKVAESKKEL